MRTYRRPGRYHSCPTSIRSGSRPRMPPQTLRSKYLLPSRSSSHSLPRPPRSSYLLSPKTRLSHTPRSSRSCKNQGQGLDVTIKVKVLLMSLPMRSRLLKSPRPWSRHLWRPRLLKRSRIRLPHTPRRPRSCRQQDQGQAATARVRTPLLQLLRLGYQLLSGNTAKAPTGAKNPDTPYPTEVDIPRPPRSSP